MFKDYGLQFKDSSSTTGPEFSNLHSTFASNNTTYLYTTFTSDYVAAGKNNIAEFRSMK